MKNIILVCALVFFSCNKSTQNHTEQLKQEIIATDTAMSNLSTKEGFNNSILFYAHDNIVKLREGNLPVIGKIAFEASYDKNKDTKGISWKPVNAEVAKSGELGYTWGNWKFIANDTVFYGNYFTVWKKNSDRNWKVVLDGGNNTPKPTH